MSARRTVPRATRTSCASDLGWTTLESPSMRTGATDLLETRPLARSASFSAVAKHYEVSWSVIARLVERLIRW